MVVHYLRLSSRSVRNVIRFHSRKFSASNVHPKSSSPLKWVPVAVGGGAVGAAALEYFYPQAITAYIPFLKKDVPPVDSVQEEKPFEAIDLLFKASQEQVKEDLDNSINKLKDIIGNESTAATNSEAVSSPQDEHLELSIPDETVIGVVEEVTDSETEAGPAKKKKKRRKKKKVEEVVPAEVEVVTVEPAETVAPAVQTTVEAAEIIPDEITSESDLTAPQVPDDVITTSAPIAATEDLTCVSPFEVPENMLLEETPDPEEIVETVTVPEPETDVSVGAIESVIESALVSDPVDEVLGLVEVKPDEAELIMDALKSLDYEPVLSDTVLDLLVGKAANREKAVIATISRLENAMANVVNIVQDALEHHNTTSALVTLAKLNAQSISEATSKEAAKELLEELLRSSGNVGDAFSRGEDIGDKVTGAFSKLSEIIEKAEQFDLKGPVDAARALLSKSRSDYYKSCEIAQENQVDHALLSHYQTSVINRKKVLDRELEILRDHFPQKHHQLNKTFESLEHHQARVDELNTLITYLSNKVGRLESELETQQNSELEKLKTVAEAQKAEDAKILEERMKGQAEQLRYKYELERQSEVESAVAAARDESARHAAKQAQILKQEMTEAAEKQIRDLNSFWSDEAALRESVVEVEYQCKLEKSNALLSGVTQMLDVQSERYQTLLYNQKLLNLTTALFEAINTSENIDAVRLQASVDLLRMEYTSDPLISAVTSSIPSSVHCSSLTILRDRLTELDGKCRKVALMTSEDCGIGSSILSRAMSVLTLHDDTYDTKPEEGGSWTLYYLNKAEREMRNNNLDTAARYLNQLVGKPRAIVTDWLKDARTLLEMRQSASVLLNYAKSRNNS